MRGIVIFESRYGSTENYARWLGEALGFDVVQTGNVKDLQSYDTVILGSYIKARKPKISGWINKNWNKIGNKRIAFFTTSGADKNDPELFNIFKKSFSDEMRSKMVYFPLNGKMVFKELSFMDSGMMKLAIKIIGKKEPELARKMGMDFDNVNKDDLKPIINHFMKYF